MNEKILEYIEDSKKEIEIGKIGKWACENKLWEEFRKDFEIYERIIEEHNKKIKKEVNR